MNILLVLSKFGVYKLKTACSNPDKTLLRTTAGKCEQIKIQPAKMPSILPAKCVITLSKVILMYTLIKISAINLVHLLFCPAKAQMLFYAYFYLKRNKVPIVYLLLISLNV